jgi:hypothetical protein
MNDDEYHRDAGRAAAMLAAVLLIVGVLVMLLSIFT